MIKVHYIKITKHVLLNLRRLIEGIPAGLQAKAMEFIYAPDQVRYVVGKLLLKSMLVEEGYPDSILEKIRYTEFKRPFINGVADFNISHSSDYVVCCYASMGAVGVDVEKIRVVNIDDYNSIFNDTDLASINRSKNPSNYFFSLWTQKEAIAKAIGRGLSVPLQDIVIKHKTATYNNEIWQLRKLDLNRNYFSHLAYQKDDIIELRKMEFQDISGVSS